MTSGRKGLHMGHSSSRRDFIKTTAQAAAAVALAPAFASRAHASVIGANDSIGVGIIGIGIRGEILLRGTRTVANTRIVQVADVYDTHFERARELVGPDLATGRDYRKLLDNKDVQAVIIAVPDHWHKQMALDAIAAGKDVYIEKPMTHAWEDGDAIIDAARREKRIVQVGSQWASVEANAQAIDIIRSGKLGQVTLIDGRMQRNTPTGAWYYPVPPDASPETIDWARFIGPAPPHPFDAARFFQWRLFWDYSGGLPTDLFVHMITATHTLMGVKMANRVMAMGAINKFKNREVPDQMSALVEYPDFTLTLTSTATNNHPYPLLTIMGTEGTLEYHGAKLVYHSGADPRELHVLDQRVAEGDAREVRRAARSGSRVDAAEGDGGDEEAGPAGDPGAGPRLDRAAPGEVLRERPHPDRAVRERGDGTPVRDRGAHGQPQLQEPPRDALGCGQAPRRRGRNAY